MIEDVSRDEYVRVARALFIDDEANDMIRAFDNGWYGFNASSPISLGLAAVSEAHAKSLLRVRPDLEERILEMQKDPERALRELRAQLDGEHGA